VSYQTAVSGWHDFYLSSSGSAFTGLLMSTVLLLVVSLRNTWDLLVTVADATQGGEGEKD
jgi:hypothetical protein